MFKSYSLTYAASIATLLASVTILEQAEALSLINALIVVITTVATLFGRYRGGDVTLVGKKK